MIYSRNVGRAKIYNVLEYSGPTHAADFVFPELDVKEIKPHLSWLAPHHYNIRLERFIVAMQLWVMHIDDKVIVIELRVEESGMSCDPSCSDHGIGGMGFDIGSRFSSFAFFNFLSCHRY
jgi:hypothetical protein